MERHLFLIELLFFAVVALGWAIFEYRKTSALQKKSRREDDAAPDEPGPPSDPI